MKIIQMKPDDLIPYINNPRFNDDAVDAVASSIKNYGFRVPIVVDKDNEIITGHTRLKAAKKLEMETVPVIIADDLSDAQVKAFRVADNKVGEIADWDFELLGLELEEMFEIDDDLFTGFSDLEIEHMADDFDVDAFFEDMEEEPQATAPTICPHCGEVIE